jgi:glycosyltransferase involved in cell wall biosynthesis
LPYTIGIDARKVQDFGIGTYIRNLIHGLAEVDRENRYLLLTTREGKKLLADLPGRFQAVVESSPVYSLRELVVLPWKIRRLGLDLYHSTHYVLPAAVPCKVVATIHDIIHLLYPEFLPNRFALLYAQRMIRHTLNRGDRIIAVSANTRQDLMTHFAVDGRKIHVIYNGVEDLFRQRLPAAERDAWLERLGVRRPYLLFVGNPKPHKNLDNLVKALAAAKRATPFAAPLVCVGGRPGSEFKIRQRAEQLGIADGVQLLGEVPQEALPALYQGAHLFLYPTLYEGFGLPVVEAMASGTPVITSNTSALREIAEGYAYLVNPLDVPGMAEAISLCVTDDERRTALARLGEQRARDFDWRQAAERTLEVYLSALAGPA